MTELQQNLRYKIEEYEKEIAELENQKKQIEKELQRKQELLGSYRMVYANETGETQNLSDRKFVHMKLVDAAFEILSEIKQAHAKEITALLNQGGKTVGGEKPFQTLSSALRQDKRFENIGKNTFRIRPGWEQKESAPLFQADRH